MLKNNEFHNFELYFLGKTFILDSDDEKITVGDDDDLAVFKQSSKPKAKMFLDLDDKVIFLLTDAIWDEWWIFYVNEVFNSTDRTETITDRNQVIGIPRLANRLYKKWRFGLTDRKPYQRVQLQTNRNNF